MRKLKFREGKWIIHTYDCLSLQPNPEWTNLFHSQAPPCLEEGLVFLHPHPQVPRIFSCYAGSRHRAGVDARVPLPPNREGEETSPATGNWLGDLLGPPHPEMLFYAFPKSSRVGQAHRKLGLHPSPPAFQTKKELAVFRS